MAGRILRGAVVGASTMLGKELAEELNDSKDVTWDLTLLDAAEAGGQITSAGDEALVIQVVSSESFAGMDVVFFAGEGATAKEYWTAATKAGTTVVDLTGALEGQAGMVVHSAWVEGGESLDLATAGVVIAHPMGAAFAAIGTRLEPLGLARIIATVLQPASVLGSAGVAELHQQTVGLLNFQPLQKELYDAQVAFNLLVSLGDAAKSQLREQQDVIARHAALLGIGDKLTLQLLQAPVFHGYAASVFVELDSPVSAGRFRKALHGGGLQVATSEDAAPSNEAAAGGGEILISVRVDEGEEQSGYWLWMAGDNLRLAARDAAACARLLGTMRPAGGVN